MNSPIKVVLLTFYLLLMNDTFFSRAARIFLHCQPYSFISTAIIYFSPAVLFFVFDVSSAGWFLFACFADACLVPRKCWLTFKGFPQLATSLHVKVLKFFGSDAACLQMKHTKIFCLLGIRFETKIEANIALSKILLCCCKLPFIGILLVSVYRLLHKEGVVVRFHNLLLIWRRKIYDPLKWLFIVSELKGLQHV